MTPFPKVSLELRLKTYPATYWPLSLSFTLFSCVHPSGHRKQRKRTKGQGGHDSGQPTIKDEGSVGEEETFLCPQGSPAALITNSHATDQQEKITKLNTYICMGSPHT